MAGGGVGVSAANTTGSACSGEVKQLLTTNVSWLRPNIYGTPQTPAIDSRQWWRTIGTKGSGRKRRKSGEALPMECGRFPPAERRGSYGGDGSQVQSKARAPGPDAPGQKRPCPDEKRDPVPESRPRVPGPVPDAPERIGEKSGDEWEEVKARRKAAARKTVGGKRVGKEWSGQAGGGSGGDGQSGRAEALETPMLRRAAYIINGHWRPGTTGAQVPG